MASSKSMESGLPRQAIGHEQPVSSRGKIITILGAVLALRKTEESQHPLRAGRATRTLAAVILGVGGGSLVLAGCQEPGPQFGFATENQLCKAKGTGCYIVRGGVCVLENQIFDGIAAFVNGGWEALQRQDNVANECLATDHPPG